MNIYVLRLFGTGFHHSSRRIAFFSITSYYIQNSRSLEMFEYPIQMGANSFEKSNLNCGWDIYISLSILKLAWQMSIKENETQVWLVKLVRKKLWRCANTNLLTHLSTNHGPYIYFGDSGLKTQNRLQKLIYLAPEIPLCILLSLFLVWTILI